MYLATLNDSNVLEMAMFLHKHMVTSLRLHLGCYSISYDNEYSKEFNLTNNLRTYIIIPMQLLMVKPNY